MTLRLPAWPAPVVEKLGPGLWSLPVPIPDNPLGWTLVYLVESGGGAVLVDAGWDAPAAFDALVSGLAEAGATLGDIDGVVVTHHHPDHHGLSRRVREASGAWVAMHPLDAELVRRMRDALSDDTGFLNASDAAALRRAGAPDEEFAAVARMRGEMRLELPLVPDRALVDGELVDGVDRALRAVWTPGHTPGHTCLHLEDDDRLLSGDHLLPSITPHIGLYDSEVDDSDPLADFLRSLRRLDELGPLEVLPAHQWRFDTASERIAEIVQHHEERLAALVALLTERPRTLWELTASMAWNRPWAEIPPLMRRVALSEAAAHVRLLERQGRVVIDTDGTPWSYRPA